MIPPNNRRQQQKAIIETGMTVINVASLPARGIDAAVDFACEYSPGIIAAKWAYNTPVGKKVSSAVAKAVQASLKAYVPRSVQNIANSAYRGVRATAGRVERAVGAFPAQMERTYGIPKADTHYCMQSVGIIATSAAFAGAGRVLGGVAKSLTAIKQSNAVRRIQTAAPRGMGIGAMRTSQNSLTNIGKFQKSAANSNHPYIANTRSEKNINLKQGRLEFTSMKRADGSMTVFVDWLGKNKLLQGSSTTGREALSYIKNHAQKNGSTQLYVQWAPANKQLLSIAQKSKQFSYLGKSPIFSGGSASFSGTAWGEAKTFPIFKINSYTKTLGAVAGFSYGIGQYNNKAFAEGVQQNGLVDSYNSSNPDTPMSEGGGSGGEIGGVGQQVCIIKGLFSTLKEMHEKQHLFYIPTSDGKAPFKIEELQQIVRELAVGIYVYDSVPFFSLHFDINSHLYPLIHPCYQKTLVGRVIGLLDYYMKGFLNGAFFDETFVKEWLTSKTEDEALLKSRCIDLREYCQTHLGGETPYFSIRELLDIFERNEKTPTNESPLLSDYSGFRSSFRIIAKQKGINKTENMFLLDGDFDVFYSIEPDPVYAEELKKYQAQYGRDPVGYTRLVRAYDGMKHQIKEMMPLLPVFRDLFEMLKVINFFSYYFKTLKRAQKIPVFDDRAKNRSFACPPLFPHLPIRKVQRYKFNVDFENIVNGLSAAEKLLIYDFIKTTEDFSEIPQGILDVIAPSFQRCLRESAPFSLTEEETAPAKHIKLIQDFLEDLAKRAGILSILDQERLDADSKKQEEWQSDLQAAGLAQVADKESLSKILLHISNYEHKKSILLQNKAQVEAIAGICTPEYIQSILDSIVAKILVCDREIADGQKGIGQTQEALLDVRRIIEQREGQIRINAQNLPILQKNLQYLRGFQVSENAGLQKIISNISSTQKAKVSLQQELARVLAQAHLYTPASVQQVKAQIAGKIQLCDQEIGKSQVAQNGTQANLKKIPAEIQNVLAQLQTNQADAGILQKSLADAKAFQNERQGILQKLQMFITTCEQEKISHLQAKAAMEPMLAGVKEIVTGLAICEQKISTGLSAQIEIEEVLNRRQTAIQEGVANLQVLADAILQLKGRMKQILARSAQGGYIPMKGSSPIIQLFTEQPEEEKRITKRIVGGCGMDVKSMPITEDPIGPQILNDSYAELLTSEAEEWIPVKGNSGKKHSGYVFKLNLLNFPTANENDYAWMQMSLTPESSEETELKAAAFNALQDGDLEAFKGQIQHRKSLQAKDPNGFNLTHYAAVKPAREHLKELIRAGASLDSTDFSGYTPLHCAASAGLIENLSILIDAHPKAVNSKAQNLATPLNLAVQENRLDCMRALLKSGADVNNRMMHGMTPLYSAIHHGYEQMALELLDVAGIDVDCALEDGTTPLYLAVETGQLKVIEKLIAKKADIKKSRIDSYTPIHIAAKKGSMAVCQLIFQHPGIDPNLALKSGKTALHLAAEHNHPSIVLLFLKMGVLITNFGWDRESALLTAIRSGNVGAVHHLIHHAQVTVQVESKTCRVLDLPDIMGETPLKAALKSHLPEIVQVLIQHKAILPAPADFLLDLCEAKVDPLFIRNWIDRHAIAKEHLERAYYMAAQQGHNQMVALFQSIYQLDDFKDEKGWTVAHFAAKFDNVSALRRFLKTPQDLLQKDREGKTLPAIAAEHGSHRVLKLLLDAMQKQKISLEGHYQASHLLFPAIAFSEPLCAGGILHYMQNPDIPLDSLGRSATHLAAINGDVEMLEFLRIRGCRFDIADKSGKTAFHYAFEYEWKDAVDYLLNKKYEITVPQDAVDFVLSHGTPKQKKLLLKKGFCSKSFTETASLTLSLPSPKVKDKDDPLFENEDGASLLHICATQSKPELLLSALEQSGNIDVADKEGCTPLYYAIQTKQQDQAELLLNMGANPNHQTKKRTTPLMYAVVNEQPFACQLLIKHGAKVDQRGLESLQTPLHVAAENGSLEIVKILVARGAEVNKADLFGRHPIHLAAMKGHLPLIRLLLAMGAALNAKDQNGKTVMHYAALSKNSDLIDYLQEAGLSAQKQTKITHPSLRKSHHQKEGVTPLHQAVVNGQLGIVRKLVETGSDVNALVDSRLGVLFYAVMSGKVDVLKFFTDLGHLKNSEQRTVAIQAAIIRDAIQQLEIFYTDTPVDLCLDARGTTGLHLAAAYGSRRCLHYFMENGADPQKSNLEGETAFEVAVKTKHLVQARYIAKQAPQLDLHRKLKEGKTYLHIASEKGDEETAAWLLEKGLSVEEIDDHGFTPLHYAAKQGSYPLLHLFLACGANSSRGTLQKLTIDDMLPPQAQVLKPLIKTYRLAQKNQKARRESEAHTAIRLNDAKHFPLLLRLNDLNHQNRSGSTPLHFAVRHENPYFFRCLIENGADLEFEDYKGRTPLFLAASKGKNIMYVETLLKLEADLTVEDIKGRSLLHAIAQRTDLSSAHEFFALVYHQLPKEERVSYEHLQHAIGARQALESNEHAPLKANVPNHETVVQFD